VKINLCKILTIRAKIMRKMEENDQNHALLL